MDIYESQLVQIQNHLLISTFDLNTQRGELRTSKFAA